MVIPVMETKMSRTIRIGIQIGHDEPFWAQVHEVIWQRAQTIAVELIEITIEESALALK